MDYEDIKPITYMKTKSAELLKKVKASGKPVFISQNGEVQVVVQGIEEFKKQKELLLMLQLVALGEKDIESGKVIEQEALFSELDKNF